MTLLENRTKNGSGAGTSLANNHGAQHTHTAPHKEVRIGAGQPYVLRPSTLVSLLVAPRTGVDRSGSFDHAALGDVPGRLCPGPC